MRLPSAQEFKHWQWIALQEIFCDDGSFCKALEYIHTSDQEYLKSKII
jgi:hypothetical protein